MKIKIKIIPDVIKEYIRYEPETGNLYRIKKTGNRCKIGQIAHKNRSGRIQFFFKSSMYSGHRVAWFLMTGEQPNVIDHIDGNKLNNKFNNLRNGTFSDNNLNRQCHRNGQAVGICFDKHHNLWRARLPGKYTKDNKQRDLGNFKTQLAASEAVQKAIRQTKRHT